MSIQEIKQIIEFPTNPERLFEILTDASVFAEVTGAPATLTTKVGEDFSLFGGWIVGSIVEIVPGSKIVQNWRAKTWDEGVLSKVTFALSGSEDNATITFEHSGFPDGEKEHLEQGWDSKYWTPIKDSLEEL